MESSNETVADAVTMVSSMGEESPSSISSRKQALKSTKTKGKSTENRIFGDNFMNMNSAAAQQPTPQNINRFVLLIIYIIYGSVSASIYFGWPGLSNMIFRAGGYEWLCEGKQLIMDKRYKCEAQDTAVQSLYQFAATSHYVMGAVAGVLNDSLGPRVSALLGQVMGIVGWLLISWSNENFVAYVPGHILIGLAADTGFLPILKVSSLFPGNEGLIVGFVGASASASFAIPSIMDAIQLSTGYSIMTMFGGYICILVLCCLVAVFLIPMTLFLSEEELAATSKAPEVNPEHGIFKRISKNLADSKTDMFSVHFMVIIIVFAFTAIAYNFFVISGERLLTTDINDIFGKLTPFSVIPTIIYGRLVDYFGVVTIISINTFVGIGAYFFVLISSNQSVWLYIAAICACIQVSFITSQVYCFTNFYLSSSHFGKLCGISVAIGGVLSLVSNFLYDPVVKTYLNFNFYPICCMMIALLLINVGVLLYLRFYGGTPPKQQRILINAEEQCKNDLV